MKAQRVWELIRILSHDRARIMEGFGYSIYGRTDGPPPDPSIDNLLSPLDMDKDEVRYLSKRKIIQTASAVEIATIEEKSGIHPVNSTIDDPVRGTVLALGDYYEKIALERSRIDFETTNIVYEMDGLSGRVGNLGRKLSSVWHRLFSSHATLQGEQEELTSRGVELAEVRAKHTAQVEEKEKLIGELGEIFELLEKYIITSSGFLIGTGEDFRGVSSRFGEDINGNFYGELKTYHSCPDLDFDLCVKYGPDIIAGVGKYGEEVAVRTYDFLKEKTRGLERRLGKRPFGFFDEKGRLYDKYDLLLVAELCERQGFDLVSKAYDTIIAKTHGLDIDWNPDLTNYVNTTPRKEGAKLNPFDIFSALSSVAEILSQGKDVKFEYQPPGYEYGDFECGGCKGEGYVPPTDIEMSPFRTAGGTCKKCEGTGKIDRKYVRPELDIISV